MAGLNTDATPAQRLADPIVPARVRTRIKFCGMTREQDVDAAVALGVDAIGMVFYEKAARAVSMSRAADLVRRVPPFVTAVGLFVNADEQTVVRAVQEAGIAMLQFHGDETPEICARLAQAAGRPWIRALRIAPTMTSASIDALASAYAAVGARGVVLDALVDGFGGGGHVFDWSVIPATMGQRAILGGGLHAGNVAAAVQRVRPFAVDVSSGTERPASEGGAKGVKDLVRMQAFIDAVRQADAALAAP
ncbi:phosphoribosylanthranilate isomerase [Robbsia sp. KACC 23696]|uniref:phosphoribosylanthranilate isomerase n=1 Tax=Robbsia sp. KACC 23696 TaxID=3149231 RepID=UPI00325B8229